MSLQQLIDAARAKLTPEEREARAAAARERMKQMDLEAIERYRCPDCGVDTINYSHTFKCPWRGVC